MTTTDTIEGLGRALFEEAGDALFLYEPDTDRLLDVNPMAERLTGFRRADLLKLPASSCFRFGGPRGGGPLKHAAAQTGVFHNQEGFQLRTPDDDVWVPVNLSVSR